MSEEPGTYRTDADDALEMLGKGYHDGPSTVIEPPRKTLRRKKGEDFEEHESPAWIKFSTAFKDELPDIGGNALKVWIYIALSVNYRGEAFPGIMTIAKGIGLSHPTVLDAIRDLEALQILTVRRGEKRHNIYAISDDYVAIGKGQSVKKVAWSEGDDSTDHERKSSNHETRVSSNKKEQEGNKSLATIPENSDPAWLLKGGVSSEEIAALTEKATREKAAAELWEREMGYNPLSWWDDRKLTTLLRFLVDCSPDEIHAFADWCKRPFSSFSPAKARQHPELVRELWPQAFGQIAPQEQYEEM